MIFHFDNSKFYALYVDLLTRPVPVKFDGEPNDVSNAEDGELSSQ